MMTVCFPLSGDDRLAYLRHSLARRPPAVQRLLAFRRVFLPGLAAAVFAAVLVEQWPRLDTARLTIAMVLALCLSAVWLQLWRNGNGYRRWLARQNDTVRLAISASGLRIEDRAGSRWHGWDDLVAMEETASYVFLHLRHETAQIVPRRTFADASEFRRFTGLVRTWWAETPAHAGTSLPSQCPAATTRRRQWRREYRTNLLIGARLAFFRRTDPDRLTPTPEHVLVVWMWILLLPAMIDYVFALPDPRFDPTGLSAFGCAVLIFVISVAMVTVAGGLRNNGIRLLLMLSTAQLLLVVPYALVMDAIDAAAPAYQSPLEWTIYLAFMAWMLAIVCRSLRLLARSPWPVTVFLTLLFAVWNYALTLQLPGQSLFYPAQSDSVQNNATAPIDVEAIYYRQARLLKRELKKLAAQTAGKTDLYFVGFAGDADQQVFTREVEYVRALFARRFHTERRSVLLVNNAATVNRLPLANTHNLAATLDAIGRQMDPSQDILFLFLTSHGSSDHHLTIQFAPLGMDDLSPGALKTMLDHAGIRNRVIVVSACYSGGFLDVLKNDNSLVITAARRDRTSFGCGAERNFTYFGEAYFRDALNRTSSFTKAFAIAKRIIADREAREGDTPSEPQMFVGRKIARMLTSINTEAAISPAAIAGSGER